MELHAVAYLKDHILTGEYKHREKEEGMTAEHTRKWTRAGVTKTQKYEFLKRDEQDKKYYQHFLNKGVEGFDNLYKNSKHFYESMYNNFEIDRSIPIADVLEFRSLAKATMNTLNKSRNSFDAEPIHPKWERVKIIQECPIKLNTEESEFLKKKRDGYRDLYKASGL